MRSGPSPPPSRATSCGPGLPALLRDGRILRRRDRLRVFGATVLAASLTAYQLTATRLTRRHRPAPAAADAAAVVEPAAAVAEGAEVAWAGDGRGDGS